MHASVFLFGNYIFFCATTWHFLREDLVFMFILLSLFCCRFTELSEQSDCTEFLFFFFFSPLFRCDDMICIRRRATELWNSSWATSEEEVAGKMPLMQIGRYKWQIQIREESNGSTALWVLIFLSAPPRAHADGINLTWWSLRPRTILNNQPRQSDRLIYREHDTDVTALFIFSLCQRIKMQGAFAVPR